MKACEIHPHGKYVTFPRGTLVYHIATVDFEHTFCGLMIPHPFRLKNGLIADTYEGGCPFPDFHQDVPSLNPERRLCTFCKRKQLTDKK